jgi:hypothetical protein
LNCAAAGPLARHNPTAHAAAQKDFVTVRIEVLLGQVAAPREHTHLNPIVRVLALVADSVLYRPRNKKPGRCIARA